MKGRRNKRKPRLGVELALTLAVKLAAIFVLWLCFFGPETRVDQAPDAVAQALLAPSPSAQQGDTP